MASSEDIPLPHGWERKYDKNAERHYYVDHFIKKTQWDDPRLHHEQIWKQERKDMLEHLRMMFKDAPEERLRETLIETRFFEPGAVNHLINLGYKKSSLAVGPAVTKCDHKETGRAAEPAVSDSTSGAKSATSGRPVDLEMVGLGDAASMSPSARSRAEKTSPRTSTGASKRTRDQSDAAGDDHFTLLHMKAMFPETNDDVLVDVLNQCGQNLELACRELRNMGYAGRQKADVRIVESVLKTDDVEKVRKHREKEVVGAGVNFLAYDLRKEIDELESKITILCATMTRGDGLRLREEAEDMLVTRKHLQDVFHDAVLINPRHEEQRTLESRMWKNAFYRPVEALRLAVQSGREQEFCRTTLLVLIEEAACFYQSLIEEHETNYDFKVDNFCYHVDDKLTNIPAPAPFAARSVKYSLECCQRYLVALGDLAGYREQVKQTSRYGRARSFYNKAAQLAPMNGRAHNQLALLATYTSHYLDAAFHYVRSLAAKNTFDSARDELACLFEDIRKKVAYYEAERPKEQHFDEVAVLAKFSAQDLHKRCCAYLLRAAGILFTKIGVDCFEATAELALLQLRALLNLDESPLSATHVVQLTVIFLFLVHHTSSGETERGSIRAVQNYAILLSFSVFGLLLERLERFLHDESVMERFSKEMHALLPAIRIFCVWMTAQDAFNLYSGLQYSIGGLVTEKFRISLWENLAKVCTIIEIYKNNGKLKIWGRGSSGEAIDAVLPEDLHTTAVFDIFPSKPASCKLPKELPSDIAAEHIRLKSLLELTSVLQTPSVATSTDVFHIEESQQELRDDDYDEDHATVTSYYTVPGEEGELVSGTTRQWPNTKCNTYVANLMQLPSINENEPRGGEASPADPPECGVEDQHQVGEASPADLPDCVVDTIIVLDEEEDPAPAPMGNFRDTVSPVGEIFFRETNPLRLIKADDNIYEVTISVISGREYTDQDSYVKKLDDVLAPIRVTALYLLNEIQRLCIDFDGIKVIAWVQIQLDSKAVQLHIKVPAKPAYLIQRTIQQNPGYNFVPNSMSSGNITLPQLIRIGEKYLPLASAQHRVRDVLTLVTSLSKNYTVDDRAPKEVLRDIKRGIINV